MISKLKLVANSNEFAKYEWTINNSIQTIDTPILVLETNDLIVGENLISLKVQTHEPCNLWSEPITKKVIITQEELFMEKDMTIDIKEPSTTINTTLDYTGIVIVNIKNQIGNPVPNATVSIDDITSISDENGVATLKDVPYALNKTLKVKV